jgi:hypothetical protein
MSLTRLTEKWMHEKRIDKDLVLVNMIKLRLSKPVMDGYIVVNLKTGKTRKLRQGEFRPMVIDCSDPSFEDGDIVQPKKERGKSMTKLHGKYATKDGKIKRFSFEVEPKKEGTKRVK